MSQRFVVALLLSACTVRNPSFEPDDARPSAERGARPDLGPVPYLVHDLAPTPGDVGRERAAADLAVTDLAAPDRSAPDDLAAGEARSCLSDEHGRGNRCYALLSPLLPVDQKAASQLCAARGATLVAIGGAPEDAFLYGLLPATAQGVWLGLVRTGPGKQDFAWLNGEPFVYQRFAPGEPNNAGGVEDCVVLWGPGLVDPALRGRWNDAPCGFPRDRLLCERVLP